MDENSPEWYTKKLDEALDYLEHGELSLLEHAQQFAYIGRLVGSAVHMAGYTFNIQPQEESEDGS